MQAWKSYIYKVGYIYVKLTVTHSRHYYLKIEIN